MVKDGLKNEELISELLTSGSRAIDTRNEFGVHIFEGSDLDDGVVSGRLSRPKYNISELEKSVNVTITELLPTARPTPPQTVPIEVYNAATQSIEQRDDEIVRLSGVVTDLQTNVSSLQSEVQALDIEIDGVKNLQGIAQNQAQVANQRTASSISQLQYSIQKATQEAIQRASLQAQNEVLFSENAQLRGLLFGKTAQQQAGAETSGKLFTANAQPQTRPSESPIRASQRFKLKPSFRTGVEADNKSIQFSNGSKLIIFNSSTNKLKFEIKTSGDTRWFSISPTEFEVEPSDTFELNLNTKNNFTNAVVSSEYTGLLVVKATSIPDGESEEITFRTKIVRYR